MAYEEIKKTNLPTKWEKAFEKYEALTGFEPMHLEDIRSGNMTIRDAWESNINWFRDLCGDVQNISTPTDDLYL
jgi:hypothetical protein